MAHINYLTNFIQPAPADALFWKQRIAEHALVLSDLLNPDTASDLKHEATQFYIMINNNSDNEEFMNLFYAFLETVRNKIADIPDINLEIPTEEFYDLVRHMILEHTYVVRLLNGQMTIKEELLFWLQETAEHTTLLANLLPEGQLREEAGRIAEILRDTRALALENPAYLLNSPNIIKASIEAASLINNEVISHRVQIDQRMILHEILEAEYGLERVNFLLQNVA